LVSQLSQGHIFFVECSEYLCYFWMVVCSTFKIKASVNAS